MIKAVIFDLGRTIVPFDFERGYTRLAELAGIPPDEVRRRIRSTALVEKLESGQIESRDFVQKICAALDTECGYEEFREIWGSIFLPETLVPESLLRAIAKKYRLVLLSNTNAMHIETIRENYTFLRHFHALVLSHEVGAMKPAPAIYARAVAAAGCLPHECFFTDDIPEYVEGARQFGIDAVRFESAAQIEDELRRRISFDSLESGGSVALNVRSVEYFHVRVENAAERAYALPATLAAEGINLLAFSAVPFGDNRVEFTLFPESGALLLRAARKLGWELTGPHHAVLIQGDDHLGALADIHNCLNQAGVKVYASSGVTDGSGHFGYVIYFRDEDHLEAARAIAAVSIAR